MRRPPRRVPPAVRSVVRGVVGFAAFLVVLEVVPRSGLVSPDYLPPISTIVAALTDEATAAAFWLAVGDTMLGWAIGLTVAFVLAVSLGLAIGSVPLLRSATTSTIEFLRPIPSVALIPLAVLLYGTEIGSTLLLVVYASFWQVLVQVVHGVQDVDPVARDTARSFGLGWWARLRHVTWPTALPYVLTGLRLAATVALILAITAELVIGGSGLGQQIAIAQQSGAVATMYALVVAAGALGVAINVGLRQAERYALRWHTSVRGELVA
jgi:ABC-type nitrate/sulfonate/bicarbonate transport system permease component